MIFDFTGSVLFAASCRTVPPQGTGISSGALSFSEYGVLYVRIWVCERVCLRTRVGVWVDWLMRMEKDDIQYADRSLSLSKDRRIIFVITIV